MSELMAIGDSLFNGVRSLTINRRLASWSAPAQVARALGLDDFRSPDYPRAVVIDLENWLNGFPFTLPLTLLDIDANVGFWRTNPHSGLAAFDNIAIASSRFCHLYDWDWRQAQARLDDLEAKITRGEVSKYAALPDLFFFFNSRFLLNPTGDPAAPAQSPLEIARARQPKRLLISIGANDGLWDMAFGAKACDGLWQGPAGLYDPDTKPQFDTFVDQVIQTAKVVGHIYINSLPCPGTTAALMPCGGDADRPPGAGQYYSQYENRIGYTYQTLTGDEVRANDAVVRTLNQALADAFKGVSNVHITPIGEAFETYNSKVDRRAKTVPISQDKTLSNLMLDLQPDMDDPDSPGIWSGGLMGLDGMHPTIVGYNIMAQTILAAIEQAENIKAPRALPTIRDAYAADALLSVFPPNWHDVMWTWQAIRKGEQTGQPAGPAPMPKDHTRALMMMATKPREH